MPYQDEAPPRRWFRRADVLVAAALLLMAGGVCVPAVVRQWGRYHAQSCRNNLAAFGESLQAYADLHDGQFPQARAVAGPRGVAGVYVPVLHEAGLLPATVSVTCPAEGRRPASGITLADLEGMRRTQPCAYDAAVRELSPGYAYSLGYEQDGALIGPRRGLGDLQPILADQSPEAGNSPNHGGAGQNVLFIGGHVRWCSGRNVGENGDDIYLNQHFQVLAGLRRSDTVLGSTAVSPVPLGD